MKTSNAIELAIKTVGSQSKLAAILSVKQQAVSNWKAVGFPPPNRVIAIERATNGAVTRHQLRPDIYPNDTPSPGS